jgi:hypothetical protein
MKESSFVFSQERKGAGKVRGAPDPPDVGANYGVKMPEGTCNFTPRPRMQT